MKNKYIYPETRVIETIVDNAFMLDFSGGTDGGGRAPIDETLHPGAPQRLGSVGSIRNVGALGATGHIK